MDISKLVRARLAVLLLAAVIATSGAPLLAAGAAETPILPPAPPWSGASRDLIAAADDPWLTPAEATGLVATPGYDETVAWLRRLAAAAPELELFPLGESPEGRVVWLAVVSADGVFTPEGLHRSGKPILFAQAGIHAGEIDGKDAGLMFLRDLTVGGTKRDLLARAHFLFVPILNVDGHERRSRFGRVNQRGPLEMGWRTTARNLNLNRDYAKLDTPELRALVRALDRWLPDLYLDLHVTDGADYQYDVTFGWAGPQGYSPAIAGWLDDVLRPALNHDLEARGHVPGPLIFAADFQSVEGGLFDWSAATPRYSDGYGGLRHLPAVLVENHSLKPYDQRVLGTYLLLESALRVLGERGAALREAVTADRARRPERVPLSWKVPQDRPPETVRVAGVVGRRVSSAVTGGEVMVWNGEPVTLEVPVFRPTEVASSVERPAAYWIPPAWAEVIERLAIHGVEMERVQSSRTLEVEMYRLEEPKLAPEPLEGHARVSATPVLERRRETFPPGSVRVPTDQPLGDLAVVLLEPASPDSFFQWGFFLEVLQRTEYIEAYVLAPMAEAMMREDPELRAAFERKLEEDPEFAADPRERLRFFYERTPFYDQRWRLYPVAREPAPPSADR